MISDAALINHRARAAIDAEALSEGQRKTLAVHLLTMVNIRRATIEHGHWNQILGLVAELAPSFAAQLDHITRLTDILTPEGTP